MPATRVFVSSTCYDLAPIRSQLRGFIASFGFEPVMSEYNDVLFDPRTHTHTSCIDEVCTCDAILLLVGSRYGGKAVPKAVEKVDLETLKDVSKSTEALSDSESISVTQLEVLKAVSEDVPIFSFVEQRVWNDHALYEKNKDKGIIGDIEFPSIDKQTTAQYIFEFINFLRHRTVAIALRLLRNLRTLKMP